MDFANRNAQHRASAPSPAPATGRTNASPDDKKPSRFGRLRGGNWLKIGALILLFGGTALLIAMILGLRFGGALGAESDYVKKDQMQAVFVNVNGTNGGQVYFGDISDMNKDFIRLTNVYYIQNQTAAQNSDQADSQAYNLVKLGCELHGPDDEMLINRSQVFFWENLKNDSQVAQKAAEFVKQNPKGQNCAQSQQQNSTQQGQAQNQTQQGAASTTAPAANTQNTTAPAQR
jgi:hypothetical protein